MNNENKYQFINNLPKEYHRIFWDIMIKAESNKFVSSCEKLTKQECKLIMRYLYKKDKEIERLKNGYCELKEKCNNGECDCTNEEYDGMVERNMKLSLEVEQLNNIINEMEKYLEENKYFYGGYQGEDREDDLSIIHALNKLKELKESGNNE